MTGALSGDCEAACGGRRVAPGAGAPGPGGGTPALAWLEQEALLPTHKTLKQLPLLFTPPIKFKTEAQLRREKILKLLTPPYFILCMIAIMVAMCWWGGAAARLEWAPRVWRREPWRLLTYSALHASQEHLAMNALVAALVGWRLEREQAWWRVAVVWCGGAAGGALGAGALQPGLRVVGSSASVYALLTAHLPNVCHRFGHVPLWWFRPLSVVVLGVSDTAWWAAGGDSRKSIAWAAHAFGALVGLLLGFLVFTGEHSSSRYILACRVTSAVCLLALAAAATACYSLYKPS